MNNAVGGTPIPTRPTADALSTLLSGPSTRIAHLLRVKGEWCAIFRIPLQQWLLHYSLDLPSSGEGRPRVDGCAAEKRRLEHPRTRRRQSISDSFAAGGAQETRPALPTADTAPPGSPAGALLRARVALGCLTVAIGLLLIAAPAQADFGFNRLEDNFIEAEGGPARQAGSHPFAQEIAFQLNTTSSGEFVAGAIRNLNATAPTGLAGNPTAVPQCETIAFLSYGEQGAGCPDATALGTIDVELAAGLGIRHIVTAPVYNLRPAPGVAAKLGFVISDVPVTVNLGLSPNPPYNVVGSLSDTSQVLEVFGSRLVLWGVPADPVHDPDRGNCAKEGVKGSCPANLAPKPFLTLPRSCTGPLSTGFAATSWWSGEDPQSPGPPSSFTGAAESPGMLECSALAFNPTITAQPTSRAASSPSGLDFSLDVKDEGLANPEGSAHADIEKAEVTLPEGMSVNPSQAEGLEVCSEAQLAKETAFSAPGAGCPNAAKIGSIEVETPLLQDKLLKGSLYIAKPYENEFHSLLALYIVIKNPELGIKIVQAAKVTPDPVTGQLITTTEDMPQLPFSHFRLHFKEGARSPLVTPPACGKYDVKALLTPWSGGPPVTTTSAFEVISGPDNGPCPSGGLPPFHPGLIAGTLNNAAGHFSPFNVRLFRSDSEQEITHFSIKLPPGIVGKLAGIPFCSDAAIAAAKARTGPHGGAEELASPSCPKASEVGRTLAGAGVGPSLTYVPGKVYLAGPYHGSALSIVAITAGVAGPFDLGTVVVREALKINPETAEVFIDATGSDPIPHIIKGIPVHLRDIRAYVDRPEFVLNPTSCKRTSTASTVLGSGLNFGSEADDRPVTVSTPFQAADCASLGFKPALSLSLKGGTKRGAHPALHAVLRPRAGDANSARISVQLPHSEFLEQSHINTVCTRVQFNAGAGNGAGCPAGSIYGHATVYTPILAAPLEGPVYLRSSEHPLPDLVLALHGLIDFNAVGRIDSVQGGIRNTFDFVPDAPVSKVVVDFEGGNKGLLVNSTNICKGTHKAIAKYTAHNGKAYDTTTELQAKCPKAKKHKGRRHGKRASRHRPSAG